MTVRMQNGEPIVDLIDAQGNVHPCLYSRVPWACAEYGYRIKSEKQFQEVQKMLSGIAEPGEKIKPAPVDGPGSGRARPGTARPGKTRQKAAPGDSEDEPESPDVAIIPIG